MPEGDKFVSFVSRRQQAQQKLQIGVTAAQLAKAERLSLPARQIPISPPITKDAPCGRFFVIDEVSRIGSLGTLVL